MQAGDDENMRQAGIAERAGIRRRDGVRRAGDERGGDGAGRLRQRRADARVTLARTASTALRQRLAPNPGGASMRSGEPSAKPTAPKRSK